MTCLAKQPDERWQSIQDLRRELSWVDEHFNDQAPAPDVRAPDVGRSLRRCRAVDRGGDGRGGRDRPLAGSGRCPPDDARQPFFDRAAGQRNPFGKRQRECGAGTRSITRRCPAGVCHGTCRPRSTHDSCARSTRAAADGGHGRSSRAVFSPDGEWVGFFADGKLKRVSVRGGAPITVATVPPVSRGATWSPDGTIFFTPTYADPSNRSPPAARSRRSRRLRGW